MRACIHITHTQRETERDREREREGAEAKKKEVEPRGEREPMASLGMTMRTCLRTRYDRRRC